MKKIALISNTSWYAYNFRKGLLKKLIEEGYSVYAIAPKDKFVREIEAMGCTFIELKHISNQGKNPLQDILLTLELRKILIANEIGLILPTIRSRCQLVRFPYLQFEEIYSALKLVYANQHNDILFYTTPN